MLLKRHLLKLTTLDPTVLVTATQMLRTSCSTRMRRRRKTPATHTGWTALVAITPILETFLTVSSKKLTTSLWSQCTRTMHTRA